MSYANKETLTALLICIPFISSSCLTVLAKVSSTILSGSEDIRYSCLVLGHIGNFLSVSSSIQCNIGSWSAVCRLDYVGTCSLDSYHVAALDFVSLCLCLLK